MSSVLMLLEKELGPKLKERIFNMEVLKPKAAKLYSLMEMKILGDGPPFRKQTLRNYTLKSLPVMIVPIASTSTLLHLQMPLTSRKQEINNSKQSQNGLTNTGGKTIRRHSKPCSRTKCDSFVVHPFLTFCLIN